MGGCESAPVGDKFGNSVIFFDGVENSSFLLWYYFVIYVCNLCSSFFFFGLSFLYSVNLFFVSEFEGKFVLIKI